MRLLPHQVGALTRGVHDTLVAYDEPRPRRVIRRQIREVPPAEAKPVLRELRDARRTARQEHLVIAFWTVASAFVIGPFCLLVWFALSLFFYDTPLSLERAKRLIEPKRAERHQ